MIDSSKTLTSFRKAIRESQKIIKVMVQCPLLKLKGEEYFAASQVISSSSLSPKQAVVDFSEDF